MSGADDRTGLATGAVPGRRATGRDWARLLAGVILLLLFVLVLAPLGQRWEPSGHLGRFIAERDIEANAYFYTEVEEFSVAETAVRNGLTYPLREIADTGADGTD